MKNPLSKFLGLLLLALVSFSGYSAYNNITSEPTLGATNPIPTVVALFETTLASSISSTATSFNLTSGMTKDGVTLASSTYGFIIDEGTASEEFVLADCTNTVCTNVQRGISVISGTSTVAALQKAHRRGASVKITNGPQLMIITNVFNGIQGFPRIVKYAGGISTSTIAADGDNLVSVDLLNYTVFDTAGVIAATEASAGFVELATQNEMASSTAAGTNGPLVVQAKYSTSTRQSSGLWNVITLATGYISETFFPKTWTDNYTYTGSTTFTGPVTFSSSTNGIGTATTTIFTSSGTWTKDPGLKYVVIEGVGAGATSNSTASGGGGGYFKKTISASSLGATETVTIGGTGSPGGNTSFGSHATGNGGTRPQGGSATGGDINIAGGNGQNSGSGGTGGNYGIGGQSMLGFPAMDNTPATGYGAGAAGANSGATNVNGTNGIVIVTEYY